MTVKQWIIGGVRTAVQRLTAIGLAAGTAWAAMKGLDLDINPESTSLLVVLDITITGLVTGLLLKLEQRFPPLAKWLSMGLSKSGPAYDTK